jgi:Heparinase II/III-like protein/Heparinase II/III N-terminus
VILRILNTLRRPVWYLHRFRSMPLEELPFRVSEQLERARGRRRLHAPGRPFARREHTGLADLILQWGREPAVARYWVEQATALFQREITVFGCQWPTTPEGIPDWDLDPLTGFRWPQDYCFDVPLTPKRTARPVEVKYVWELNRLLYLLPVAAHAAAQRDDEIGQLCRTHLEDWIHAHPSRRGVVWRSGIELAVRVLVFVLVLEMMASEGEADPALEALVGRAVAEHADWIQRFPSRYSSANNHRVAELIGLLVAASAYPQLASAGQLDRWWTELEAVALLQFHSDGVPAEQATMYGFHVLEWLSICLHLARRQGRELRAEARERIGSAVSFLAAITDVRGNAVRFGDDDSSRLLAAARPHGDFPSAVLKLVAEGLGVPVPQPRPGLSTFADGGYTVWRFGSDADEILWVLDHAPLGMGHLAAHAHADTLAVYLHVGGQPVFIDAGTYLYHSVGAWRDRLRGTAEHNTVAIGGQDSSMIAGPFNWRRPHRAEGRLVCATSSSAVEWSVEAEHDGYAKRYGIVHRRSLEGLGPRSFRITDRLEGGHAKATFRWSLLIAPGLDVALTTGGWVVHANGIQQVNLGLQRERLASVREESASCSLMFGQIEPTRRLVVEGDVDEASSIQIRITVSTASEQIQNPEGAI